MWIWASRMVKPTDKRTWEPGGSVQWLKSPEAEPYLNASQLQRCRRVMPRAHWQGDSPRKWWALSQPRNWRQTSNNKTFKQNFQAKLSSNIHSRLAMGQMPCHVLHFLYTANVYWWQTPMISYESRLIWLFLHFAHVKKSFPASPW